MLPHAGQDIAKGRRLFLVPSSLLEGKAPRWSERMPTERHQTVASQEQWRRALHCQVRPVSLRLQTQMRAAFLEGRFQAPALHEVSNNLLRWLGGIGRKQGFGRSFSPRVAGEHPPNG